MTERRRQSGGRKLRGALKVLWVLAAALALAGRAQAVPPTSEPPAILEADLCRAQMPTVWPATSAQRRRAIERMASVRQACLGDAPFLAVLGALLLEDGDSEQALLWLERSLLLDADNLGAQADLAIALAARGENGPLLALAAAWRDRDDVPAALRARLADLLEPSNRYALPLAALGTGSVRPEWAMQGEASVLGGYENNLDRSPSLAELTITIPGGPIVLPVAGNPRSGFALLAGMSYQWTYATSERWVWRGGLGAQARESRSNSDTDWQQYQAAGSVMHRRGALRAQLETSVVWVRGPLGEPFHQTRVGLGSDLAVGACRVRIGSEAEKRKQTESRQLDSRYRGLNLGLQCVPTDLAWTLGLTLRGGKDVPDFPDRPGGEQHVDSAALRLTGTLSGMIRLESTLRWTRSRDSTGYSDLLEDGAVRVMRLRQLAVEASAPLPGSRLELVLQWHAALQRSNLSLFSYRADALYMGLRYIL